MSGFSEQEIQDIIIPILKNRQCEISPTATETEDFIRVEFQVTFYKAPRKTKDHYKRYNQGENGYELIEEKEPMPPDERDVRSAVELLRRHYCQ